MENSTGARIVVRPEVSKGATMTGPVIQMTGETDKTDTECEKCKKLIYDIKGKGNVCRCDLPDFLKEAIAKITENEDTDIDPSNQCQTCKKLFYDKAGTGNVCRCNWPDFLKEAAEAFGK